MNKPTIHFVLMGVSGCGKTTAAVALQKHFQCPYAEGDDFHTQNNRDKMGAGMPLTDEDRYPWLASLRDWMSKQTDQSPYSLVTCSALKRRYRDMLRTAKGRVVFIHLSPPQEENLKRIANRKGHYMKAGMLASQLADLEALQPDEEGICIRHSGEPAEVKAEIIDWLRKQAYI